MNPYPETRRKIFYLAWFLIVEGVLALIITAFAWLSAQTWYYIDWAIPVLTSVIGIITGIVFVKLTNPKYWG